MNFVIIVAIMVLGIGLILAFMVLNKNKSETTATYKKAQEEKIDAEIRMLKNIKSNICSGASDEIIDNILHSENKLLKDALKNNLDDADVCKKLRR